VPPESLENASDALAITVFQARCMLSRMRGGNQEAPVPTYANQNFSPAFENHRKILRNILKEAAAVPLAEDDPSPRFETFEPAIQAKPQGGALRFIGRAVIPFYYPWKDRQHWKNLKLPETPEIQPLPLQPIADFAGLLKKYEAEAGYKNRLDLPALRAQRPYAPASLPPPRF
jgi:hypothetical protein